MSGRGWATAAGRRGRSRGRPLRVPDGGAGRVPLPSPALSAGLASLALLVWVVGLPVAPPLLAEKQPSSPPQTRPSEPFGSPTTAAPAQIRAGGYLGASYTYPSPVRISNPPGTDLTVDGFDWIGRPFKSPIYYGARIDRVPAGAGFGTLLDFTHAKAIARDESIATFTGTRNGQPVAPSGKIDDVFRHLEFSHGHNILTLNGVWRLPLIASVVRPYAGVGAGITLPHTEIGFRGENVRTYEYQFAGFAGQVLAGVEIPLGRASLFLEWKFTYAPYRVPLSHEPYGWLLVTDIWRQLTDWWSGRAPPGGWLTTVLATHHAYGGVMVRVGR